jgi:uncharacterized protein YjiS (DUF1127 family)
METTNDTLPPRRSTTGAIDIDYHLSQAREMRIDALHEAAHDIAAAIVSGLRRIGTAVHAYRKRRAAYRELATLDPRTFADVGIAHADLDAIAIGRFNSDESRRSRPLPLPIDAKPSVSWLTRERPRVRRAAVTASAD